MFANECLLDFCLFERILLIYLLTIRTNVLIIIKEHLFELGGRQNEKNKNK